MRFIDLSSWQGILTTLAGLVMITLIGVGVRLLMMLTIQQRQQRMNRQINERLKTLMSAYRVLGGSFTGKLTVDPSHLRDLRQQAADPTADETNPEGSGTASERARRIRDSVESALADILLLGTEEHVRLAGKAALEMAEGRPIHTAELVTALRSYIRKALDLGEIPADVIIPAQGPTRPQVGASAKSGRSGSGEGGRAGGEGSGGSMGGGGGGGMGMGLGIGLGRHGDDTT